MNIENNAAAQEAPPDEQVEPPSSEQSPPSPGGLMQAQRETLQMTVQQVSEHLNLTMHFVRALESDSYDKLPGDVFVRGYIRSYARLLRLDPDQVLALYDEFTSRKAARKEEAIKRITRRRRDKNKPWIAFSGVAFVGVAVALWYFNQEAQTDNPSLSQLPVFNTPATAGGAAVAASSTFGEPATGVELAQNGVADNAEVTEWQASGADTGNSRAAGNMASVVAADQQAQPGSDELPTAQIQTAQAETAQVQTAQAETAQAAAVQTETAASPAAETPATPGLLRLQWPGEDVLEITFEGESWLEIEHRGGDNSYRNMQRAGTTVHITGQAPFAVLLGNAPAAKVSYNSRQLDISNNIRADNTARLSVGM